MKAHPLFCLVGNLYKPLDNVGDALKGKGFMNVKILI